MDIKAKDLFKRGYEDYSSLQILSHNYYDTTATAAFLAEQATERFMKGNLLLAGVQAWAVHDIGQLWTLTKESKAPIQLPECINTWANTLTSWYDVEDCMDARSIDLKVLRIIANAVGDLYSELIDSKCCDWR